MNDSARTPRENPAEPPGLEWQPYPTGYSTEPALLVTLDERLSLFVSRPAPHQFVVSLRGELDAHNERAFRRLVRDGARPADRPAVVVLDLSGLVFLDAAGCRALVVLDEAVSSEGGRVTVCGARGTVHRVLRLTGLEPRWS